MQNSIWKINYFYGSEEERNKIKNCLHNNQLPFVKFFDAKSGKPTSLIYGDIVFVYVQNHIKMVVMVTRPGEKKKTTTFRSLFSFETSGLSLQSSESATDKINVLTKFTNDEINRIETEILQPEFSISMEDFLNTWHKAYREYRHCLYNKKCRKYSVYNFDAIEVQNLSKSRHEIKAQGDAISPCHRMPGSGFSRA